jgi:hypothetical protein
MSIFGSIETALLTIPGMTLGPTGQNIFTPEHPQKSASPPLPNIKVRRITDDGDYTLTVSRVMSRDRIQLTFAAASQVALEVLVAAAQTALNGKQSTFSGSPWGRGADGIDAVSNANWVTSDWILCY